MANCAVDHLRILILEDTADDVELVERELRRAGLKFISQVVDQREDFEKALSAFKPDVILSDHSLPTFNSFEALNILKSFRGRTGLNPPFILVTGAVSEEFAIQCIRAGADDYILKDRLKRLYQSILTTINKSRLQIEQKKYLDRVIANEAMMREAEGLAKFGSWQVDLQTDSHRWSDAVYRIYGYEPGEITPDSNLILKHVVDEQRTGVIEAFRKAINEASCHTHEFSIIDYKGLLKHLETKLIIGRDENGLACYLTGFIRDITEMVDSAMRLQRSQQEYKSLFEQNPDAVFSLDLAGRFTNANEALCNLSGLSRDSLLQMNGYPFLTKFESKKSLLHFRRASQGFSRQYEAAFINREGREVYVHVTNMPIIVNNQIVGVHGVAKDISTKKRLENLLRKVNDLARVGGWEVDLTNRKVKWTRITRELHEVDHAFEPSVEKGIEFYTAGKSRDTIIKAINEAIAHGTSWDEELEIMTAKGNQRWIRVIGETEFRDGRCTRLYGSIQDIHARKQAEISLKESLLEKTDILESIGDAFFAVNKNWIVTYWNKEAARRLGMPKENILWKNLWDVYKDAVPLKFYKYYHLAVAENRPVHFEEYYPANGIWVEVSAYPSPSGLSVYFRDITDLRIQTKAIAEQNRKLREIAWIQSHKVRAPLARILGIIELAKHDSDAKLNEVIKPLYESAMELDTVIREIVRKTEEVDKQR